MNDGAAFFFLAVLDGWFIVAGRIYASGPRHCEHSFTCTDVSALLEVAIEQIASCDNKHTDHFGSQRYLWAGQSGQAECLQEALPLQTHQAWKQGITRFRQRSVCHWAACRRGSPPSGHLALLLTLARRHSDSGKSQEPKKNSGVFSGETTHNLLL